MYNNIKYEAVLNKLINDYTSQHMANDGKKEPPAYLTCQTQQTVKHILIECR